MPRSIALLIAVCVAAAMLAVPATAGDSGGVVRPPSIFKTKLAKVKADSSLDVLIPSRLRVYSKPSRIAGDASADDGFYDLQLGVGRSCNGAGACYVANFAAIRGDKPSNRRRVRLRGGRTGYWKTVTCGASCAPAEIQWVEDGVLYSIASKHIAQRGEREALVRLANDAIAAGPR